MPDSFEKLRIIVSGGGTGGHVYPALSLALELKRLKADVLYIGKKGGLEGELVPAAGVPFATVSARGWSARPLRAAGAILALGLGTVQALGLLGGFRPDLVVGAGGYVSLPVIAAARMLGRRILLLEQNVLPGKVTRFLAGWAEKICLSFEESKEYLPGERCVVTGNPVRGEIVSRKREEGAGNLGVSGDGFCLLVSGGSQGAHSLNLAVLEGLKAWRDREWVVIHLTGKNDFEEMRGRGGEITAQAPLKYLPFPYLRNMADAYAVAGLYVGRAGATVLAEITARGLPGILVPYPHAADRHQDVNARWFEKNGAGMVIPDGEIMVSLPEAVMKTVGKPDLLRDMSEKSKSLGRPDALEGIVNTVAGMLI
jgi:UDP-N-acetylglucosamine--N-acetylmuramyl-(pentapeptide) pyrophosphoryl-undecaprenol N-acetylglucosamine transferase